MTNPEQAAALSALRRIAIEAHKRCEAAKLDGVTKMRVIWQHEREYRNAVRLVYSYEAMLRNREIAA
jgi:hypothetical protein